FVMSATFLATGIGNGVAGGLLDGVSPRWIWGGAAIAYLAAAVAGYVLAREPRGAAAGGPVH
ncbi:MAG TPA: hypothetical protein VJQ85_04450, partial [Gaiellaceae bacterium]|nr:hypothetical protein [Gaiellaceae bacterium]